MNSHWTDDELIASVYGAGPDNGHLDECSRCRQRAQEFAAKHANLVASARNREAALPEEFFDRQRREILRRAESSAPARSLGLWRYGSAVAGLAAVVLGVFLLQPIPPPPPPGAPANDQQLMAEVSALIESPVPSSVAPISALFEDNNEEN